MERPSQHFRIFFVALGIFAGLIVPNLAFSHGPPSGDLGAKYDGAKGVAHQAANTYFDDLKTEAQKLQDIEAKIAKIEKELAAKNEFGDSSTAPSPLEKELADLRASRTKSKARIKELAALLTQAQQAGKNFQAGKNQVTSPQGQGGGGQGSGQGQQQQPRPQPPQQGGGQQGGQQSGGKGEKAETKPAESKEKIPEMKGLEQQVLNKQLEDPKLIAMLGKDSAKQSTELASKKDEDSGLESMKVQLRAIEQNEQARLAQTKQLAGSAGGFPIKAKNSGDERFGKGKGRVLAPVNRVAARISPSPKGKTKLTAFKKPTVRSIMKTASRASKALLVSATANHKSKVQPLSHSFARARLGRVGVGEGDYSGYRGVIRLSNGLRGALKKRQQMILGSTRSFKNRLKRKGVANFRRGRGRANSRGTYIKIGGSRHRFDGVTRKRVKPAGRKPAGRRTSHGLRVLGGLR